MKIQESAGGIVFRRHDDSIEILIGQHSGHHGWVFPKGLIGDIVDNEGREETAIREVQEETGITGEILHPLKPYVIYFVWEGEKHKKTVYYYVMEYLTGDTRDHDWEMSHVEWLPLSDVEERVTYEKEKKVFREAREYIESKLTNE